MQQTCAPVKNLSDEDMIREVFPHFSSKQVSRLLDALNDHRLDFTSTVVAAVMVERAGPDLAKEFTLSAKATTRRVNQIIDRINAINSRAAGDLQ